MPQKSGDGRRNEERQSREETTGETQRAEAEASVDAGPEGEHRASQWFANTAVRIGLTTIGVVLLIFAIGQAVGLPLLEFTVEALSSQTGRWLMVAFFAVLLIAAAQKVGTMS